MFLKLLLLFVALPIIELAILVQLGTMIGFWATMALVLGTGALGAALARTQGFRVWTEIRRDLQAGRMPADKLFDGLLILIGGILLLTPGLISDLSGIALLFPPTRAAFRRLLRRRFARAIHTGRVNITTLIR